MEEAAYYADVILPACSGLELDGVYMRRDDRGIRCQDRAVDRVGESRPDWEIWIELAHALGRNDTRKPASYWTDAFPLAWKDYGALWAEFVAYTPAMGGMTEERMRQRAEPLRWPCPTTDHPGVSTLYLDHPSWYEAAAALGAAGKRFLTPSGKVEITTPDLDERLGRAGHAALPSFFTRRSPTASRRWRWRRTSSTTRSIPVRRPGGPGSVRGRTRRGPTSRCWARPGRPSVVHFASITHWTPTGKQLNDVRLIQIHPDTARRYGIADRQEIVVESPRGAVTGTALYWPGIRTDTVFVPNGFGPAQAVADESGAARYEPTNVLLDDEHYDNLSGQQAYKCFACRVRPA